MLEKIGLPAKPSMRGGSWVVDASHCQGCSSQFTFINRKHHCRRCGGLFCNSCTQQRMILRGQGDSPVRICDPCKKLEDAARFELRYGHKSRSVKGGSKLETKHEENNLNQSPETEGKQHLLSIRQPSSSSSSNFLEEVIAPEGRGDVLGSNSVEMYNDTLKEMETKSPEELRQQAAEEKKKYRILKGEGKPEEALQAFKRGKELERQAGALEIALRKSRRKASVLNNSATYQKSADEGSTSKKTIASQSTKVVKDDLLSELRELGWSDADLHDADKKPEKLSLEGELSSIIKEIPTKSTVERGSSGIDNSQVVAHKKRALMLKREGKLAEAKEELKKAKILEKQLEEQELLSQVDDSDDELSALIRNMDDDDKQDDLLADYGHDLHINFDSLSGPDDLVLGDNFDVTDDDMNDPEISAALKSFGWSEEDDHMEEEGSRSVLRSKEAMESEVLSLKREALNQKRAGNTAEAMALLKKAKLLEKDLETTQHDSTALQKKSMQQRSERPPMPENDDKIITEMKNPDLRPKPKSKLLIQRELLDLKKKALALRREGHTDEADEELRKGKELERQLEEMENATKLTTAKADVVKKDRELARSHQDISADLGFDGEAAAEVTEEDMSDPALLSVLKNLGWIDEHAESVSNTRESSKQTNDRSTQEIDPSTSLGKIPRNKAEIQRELLAIKRKALALRRQGKTKEADDELEKAKFLEKQMTEMEVQHLPEPVEKKTDVFSNSISEEKSRVQIPAVDSEGEINRLSIESTISNNEGNAVDTYHMGLNNGCATSIPPTMSERFTSGISKLEPLPNSVDKQKEAYQSATSSQSRKHIDQMDIPIDDDGSSHASVLKPSSKVGRGLDIPSLEHATPELLAVDRGNTKCNQGESAASSTVYTIDKKQTAATTLKQEPNKEASAAEGSNSLNDQILARKRKAIALKREGKLAEAREELRQAKLLEKSLEEGKHQGQEVDQTSSASISNHSSGVVQNISATTSGYSSATLDSKHQKPLSSRDRFKLQRESLAHKRQALKLRREGRIEESDAELELAKALEAQLEEIDNLNSNNKKGATDDAIVEDLLDPQLMSALKSIGWEESDIVMQKSVPKSISKDVSSSSSQERLEANSSIPINTSISPEKATLEEQIKAEKLRAVNLKRAGNQAEALEALRAAKRLEKRLLSLT